MLIMNSKCAHCSVVTWNIIFRCTSVLHWSSWRNDGLIDTQDLPFQMFDSSLTVLYSIWYGNLLSGQSGHSGHPGQSCHSDQPWLAWSPRSVWSISSLSSSTSPQRFPMGLQRAPNGTQRVPNRFSRGPCILSNYTFLIFYILHVAKFCNFHDLYFCIVFSLFLRIFGRIFSLIVDAHCQKKSIFLGVNF